MKRILYILLIVFLIVFFPMCKTPITEFDNSKNINLAPQEVLLKDFKATENKYSVIIFTTGFEGEKLIINNCDSLVYSGLMETNKTQPFAKLFRIKNTCVTKVEDLDINVSFELKALLIKKYKFVYLRKDYDKNRRYVITYSNKLMRML